MAERFGIVGQFAVRSLIFVLVMGGLLGGVLTVAIRSLVTREAALMTQTMANAIVAHHVEDADLSAYPIPSDLRQRFDRMVVEDLAQAEIVAIKLWNTDGILLYSSDRQKEGESFKGHDPYQAALRGEVEVEVAPRAREENEAQIARAGRVIEVYAPLRRHGRIIGVFEVYQAYAPVARTIERFVALVWIIIAAGSIPAYFLQLTIVKRTADQLTTARGALAEVNARLKHSLEDMEMHSLGTLQALVAAVDAKDSYTARHSIAVTDYAVAIARQMGLSEEQVADIERAGLLHDVGKIGTPEAILLKPGKLTPEEFDIIKEHSEMGGHIIETVPFLSRLMPAIRSHHERWDGTGYPDGLAGERIPLYARILAVADAFDAMTSERPYREPVSVEVARAELVRCAASQFDANVVQAMIAVLDAGEARVTIHTEAARERAQRASASMQ